MKHNSRWKTHSKRSKLIQRRNDLNTDVWQKKIERVILWLMILNSTFRLGHSKDSREHAAIRLTLLTCAQRLEIIRAALVAHAQELKELNTRIATFTEMKKMSQTAPPSPPSSVIAP